MADKYLKIAYIGGGSRAWARKLMCDLAVADDICGEVRLYDIDKAAAKDNEDGHLTDDAELKSSRDRRLCDQKMELSCR